VRDESCTGIEERIDENTDIIDVNEEVKEVE